MQGFVAGDSVFAGWGHFVVGEGVGAGDVAFFHFREYGVPGASCVDDGMAQEGAGGVDGGPDVGGSFDEDGGVACLFEFFVVFGAVVVAVDAVVREDDGFDSAEEGFSFAEFSDVVVEAQAVCRVVVQE